VELAFYEQPDGVLVAACRKSFLHTYLAPFVQTGLAVRWVVPSVIGLWASVTAPPSESWGLIELRGNPERWLAATLALGKGRHLRLVHSVPFNGDGAERLTDELQRAFALYHRSFSEPITRLFAVGDGALLGDVSAHLARTLQLSVEDLPLAAEGNNTAERVLSTIAATVPALPASASFPPPQPEPALAWRRLEERLIGAVAVLAVVGLVAALMLSSRARALQTQVAEKQTENAQLEQALNRLDAGAYATKVQAMEQLWRQVTDPRNDPLEVLYAVSKALPASAWVTEMAFLRDGQVVLRGSALSHGAVADAARALSSTFVADNRPLFVEVQTNFANARTEGGKTFVDFQITGWLRERNLRGQRQVQRP
jgi:Tfp pilus assembly protein PilN